MLLVSPKTLIRDNFLQTSCKTRGIRDLWSFQGFAISVLSSIRVYKLNNSSSSLGAISCPALANQNLVLAADNEMSLSF